MTAKCIYSSNNEDGVLKFFGPYKILVTGKSIDKAQIPVEVKVYGEKITFGGKSTEEWPTNEAGE